MALSWRLVSGCASGSTLAAAAILLFSSTEGIRRVRLGAVFDIVLDLSALRISKTYDSSDFTSFDECNFTNSGVVAGASDYPKLRRRLRSGWRGECAVRHAMHHDREPVAQSNQRALPTCPGVVARNLMRTIVWNMMGFPFMSSAGVKRVSLSAVSAAATNSLSNSTSPMS